MELKSREVTAREVEIAQEMFSLGIWLSKNIYKDDFDWILYKKGKILSKVTNDATMTSLLKNVFRCGITVAEKRKQKDKQPDA
jgi:hypothetical protein